MLGKGYKHHVRTCLSPACTTHWSVYKVHKAEETTTYKKLTQANLRWFWNKYSRNGKLTTTGAEAMAQIMASEKYSFSIQPRTIQNSILHIMESCEAGQHYLKQFTRIGLEVLAGGKC